MQLKVAACRTRADAFVVVALVCLSCAIMAPRLVSPEFGLLDDGVTLAVSNQVLHDPSILMTHEATRGRFRPAYWLYYVLQYPLWGTNPAGYFITQGIALLATGAALAAVVNFCTGSRAAGLVAALSFMTSAPVWENYYTLSKPEPAVVLFLALSTLFLFRALRNARVGRTCLALACAFVVLAYFTKETVIVMLPISLALVAVGAGESKGVRRILVGYCIANVVAIAGYFILRAAGRTYAVDAGNDSFHYRLDAAQIYGSMLDAVTWVIRDYAYAVLLVVVALIFLRGGQACASALTRMLMGFGLLLCGGLTLVMLPWHSSLEYYLLPFSMGIALAAGASVAVLRGLVERATPPTRRTVLVTGIVAILLAPLPVLNGVSNARVQLAADGANAEFLRTVARDAAPGSTVIMDVPEGNEYVHEAAVQLRILYGRGDLHIDTFESSKQTVVTDALFVSPVMQNKEVVLPRVAGYATSAKSWLEAQGSASASRVEEWSSIRRGVDLAMVAPEEPMCRLLRAKRLAGLSLCANPLLLVDRRTFTYGWDLYLFHAATLRS